jgi:hypothetical protein
MAKSIRTAGAVPFLDESNIAKGSDFKRIVHEEIACCDELVALLTPWSVKRSWVWIEIGAAWGQRKPVLAVFHGMAVSDLEVAGQGKAVFEDINTVQLNDFGSYVTELSRRAKKKSRGSNA